LLGLTAGAYLLYRASQDVPEFYEKALQADPQRQREASDEMVQRAAALASDVNKQGDWQTVFTAEQINGWLAVDMVENHPDLLPSSLSDPRVAIEPEQLLVACRLERGKWKGVVSLSVDVYLAKPNVLALRIRKARAGLLPIPLKTITDEITERAEKLDLGLRWRQAEGDPVAEIPIPPPRDADDRAVRVETVRLGEGRLYLAGSTEPL
jgi:hypothetical protein